MAAGEQQLRRVVRGHLGEDGGRGRSPGLANIDEKVGAESTDNHAPRVTPLQAVRGHLDEVRARDGGRSLRQGAGEGH